MESKMKNDDEVKNSARTMIKMGAKFKYKVITVVIKQNYFENQRMEEHIIHQKQFVICDKRKNNIIKK